MVETHESASSYVTGQPHGRYDLLFSHYWKSLSDVPAPSVRGYQMFQTAGPTIAGVATDLDTVQKDNLDGLPIYLHI